MQKHTKIKFHARKLALAVFICLSALSYTKCDDDFNNTIREENAYNQFHEQNNDSNDNLPNEYPPEIISPVPGNSGAITITLLASGDVHLRWERASDTVYPASKLRYCAYYSNANSIATVEGAEMFGTPASDYAEDVTSITIKNLKEGTQYYFNILVATPDNRKAAYSATSIVIPGTIYLYATIKTYRGNMAELAASARLVLDSYCEPLKNISTNDVPINRFRAFISITENDAIANFPTLYNVPTNWKICSISKKVIAYSWYDLLDGSINTKLEAAGVSDSFWWSGSFFDGQFDPTNNCQYWTNGTNKALGKAGAHNALDESWISGDTRNCNNALKLLCIGW